MEVFVLKLSDYLKNFWPTLPNALNLYEGLRAVHTDLQLVKETEGFIAESFSIKKDTGYEEHWRQEAVETALKSGKLIQGRIHVNKYHSEKEAFVSRKSTGAESTKSSIEDVLIAGLVDRNRAIHGDVVAVELFPKSRWKSKLNRLSKAKEDKVITEDDDKEEDNLGDTWDSRADVCPTGRVVAILQRQWKSYPASFTRQKEDYLASGQQRILVIPYDRRIRKIRIATSQAGSFIGKRIIVKIDNWPRNSKYPNGHFVRELGEIGNLDAELESILVEHDIYDCTIPFSKGVLNEMPTFQGEWKPDQNEVQCRRDLRDQLIMSIDPQGCTDVDDTLSVKRLGNGNIELGIHIADVTHFLDESVLTDQEARRRGTTVYLADRRYEMLPSVLSSNLCSLLGGTDRYAVSVISEIQFHPTFKVIKTWFGRTLIRSSYKMTYEAAQNIIDKPLDSWGNEYVDLKIEVPEFNYSTYSEIKNKLKILKEHLLLLSKTAKKIQNFREEGGALKLESGSEVQFEFEQSSVDKIKPKLDLAVHDTVAECMIFANHMVAKKISDAYPHQSLLRRHPSPETSAFEELKKVAASKGWDIDVWSNKVLAESLDKCRDKNDPIVNLLLRSLATQAMEQAVYFSTGEKPKEKWEHYGLALQHYTHFTSPIRRYADVIVHRLLLSALKDQDWWSDKNEQKKVEHMTNSQLSDLCDHINERNKAAQLAQRQSQLLFQTLFFQNKQPDDPLCIVEAVILRIRNNGFLVYVPCYALKGPVYLQVCSYPLF